MDIKIRFLPKLENNFLVKREAWVQTLPSGNPHTYVRRICDRVRRKKHTRHISSAVDIDHRQLKYCCGKWKVNNDTVVYTHRIV